MFSTIRTTLADAFESTLIRYGTILLALGGAPVFFLSMCKASLAG